MFPTELQRFSKQLNCLVSYLNLDKESSELVLSHVLRDRENLRKNSIGTLNLPTNEGVSERNDVMSKLFFNYSSMFILRELLSSNILTYRVTPIRLTDQDDLNHIEDIALVIETIANTDLRVGKEKSLSEVIKKPDLSVNQQRKSSGSVKRKRENTPLPSPLVKKEEEEEHEAGFDLSDVRIPEGGMWMNYEEEEGIERKKCDREHPLPMTQPVIYQDLRELKEQKAFVRRRRRYRKKKM